MCESGQCVCNLGYTGLACEKKVECQYWDNRIDNWSTEGCVASPPPTGRPDGFLHCNCTHLTDFGGVQFPTSAEEILADMTSISFNVISLDDMSSILSEFDIAGNPVIFTVLTCITVADLLMILYNKFRGHRRVLTRGRGAVKRRKALRDAAREKAKAEGKGGDDDVLANRKSRKKDKMGQNAKKEFEEKEKKQMKKNPPIQDRIFLDLLDPTAYTPNKPPTPAATAGAKRKDAYAAAGTPSSPKKAAPGSASKNAAIVTPAKSDAADSLLNELLAPGVGLPAMPAMDGSDGPVVPWAELLQQRIQGRGNGSGGSGGMGSTACQMVQQRLPSRAQLHGRDGDAYSTPPSRQSATPSMSGGGRPPSSFNSARIPNCTAMLSGARGGAQAQLRLENMSSPPVAAPAPIEADGLSSGGMRQERITNLGSGPRQLGNAQAPPKFTTARLPLRGSSSTANVASPTVAGDGTVSSRLPMRRSSSNARGGLVLPPSSRQMAGGGIADAAAPAAAPSSDAPFTPTTPSAADAEAEAPAAAFLGRLSRPSSASHRASLSAAPTPTINETDELTAPSPPTSPPEAGAPVGDDQLGGLLTAVSTALGTDEAPAAEAGSQPKPPALRSTRLPLRMPAPPASDATANGASAPPPPPRMQSSRLRMLPKPPPAAAAAAPVADATASAAAWLEAEEARTTPSKALAASADLAAAGKSPAGGMQMQSARLRLMHKPAGSAATAARPALTAESLRALSKSIEKDTSADDADGGGASGVAVGVPVPEDAEGKAAELKRDATRRRMKMMKLANLADTAETKKDRRSKVVLNKAAVLLNPGAKAAARMSKFGAMKAVGALKSAVHADELKDAAGGTAAAAVELKKELREALTSPKKMAALSKKVVTRGAKRVKRFGYDFIQTARSEHTVMNALAPPEEDILGDSLQDEQIIHIFWTLVLAELCMINLLSLNEDDGYPIFKIFLYGMITSLACSVVAKILKDTFKFCNKKRRRQSLFDRIQRRWYRQSMERRQRKEMKREMKKRGFKPGTKKAPVETKKSLKGLVGKQMLQTSPKKDLSKVVEVKKLTVARPTLSLTEMSKVDIRKAMKKRAAQRRFAERQSYLRPLEATFAPQRVQRMRREAEHKAEQAIKIQGLIRRRQARRELLKRRKDQGYDAAAMSLQNARRRQEARRKVDEKRANRKAKKEDEAAITLQKVSRGRKMRAERKQQEEAAMTMQRIQRGRYDRRKPASGEAAASAKATVLQMAAAAGEMPQFASRPASQPDSRPPSQPTRQKTTGRIHALRGSNKSEEAADRARLGLNRPAPDPPPSPPEGDANAATPPPPKNRFLARLAASAAAPEADSGAGALGGASPATPVVTVAATAHAATPAGVTAIAVAANVATPGSSAAPTPHMPSDRDSKKTCKFAALLSSEAGQNADARLARRCSTEPAPSSTIAFPAPTAAAAGGPPKNKFLARLAAAQAADGGGGGGAPAGGGPSGAKPNPLLLKAFGGAAGGGGAPAVGGADADVFKKNRFLAQFANKVQGGEEGDDGDGGAGGGEGKKRTGKQLWQRAKGVKMMTRVKVSADEAERIRRSKLVPFSRKYILMRWTIGWLINIVFFVFCWLLNFMYGVFHGPPTMDSILLAWVAGLFQTFIIVEPSEVLALVLIPSIAENACIAKCKANAKEYGFI